MLIAALGAVAVVVMVWLQVRDTRKVGQRRRDAVARAEEILTDVEVTQDGIGYPTLRGRFAGHPAKVELIVDTLTLRQLPRLWLAVTVQRPTRVGTPFDVVLRPSSSDIVSPGARFAYEHPHPVGWPPYLRLTTTGPDLAAGLGEAEALTSLLHENETKSVLVTSRGVRIVTELARGDVGPYRVTRRPDFRFVLEAARLRRVLDDALAVAEDLDHERAEVGC
jgi:hypothetical protein